MSNVTRINVGTRATQIKASGPQGPRGLPGADGGGGVEEAPEDGTTYGRKDAGWAAIPGGGDLLAENNLADIDDAPTALANLGGASSAQGALAETSLQPSDVGTTVAELDGGVVPDGQLPAGLTRDSEMAAYVAAALDAKVDGAPSALDTLNELAAAINDDPDFAATITALIAGKQASSTELTLLAALTSTTFGRSLLEIASSAAGRAAFGVEIGSDVQAHSATLDATTAAFTTALATLLSTALQPADVGSMAAEDAGDYPTSVEVASTYAAKSEATVTVDAGSTAGTARPTGWGHVQWIVDNGVTPTNAENDDLIFEREA